jgi:flagellar assembly protein FliH
VAINDKKFLFDLNIFDAPPKEEIVEDLPPPPPSFSEDELAAAKDMAFEQGRIEGQKEQRESREQFVAQNLAKIADSLSHLFAAEKIRENIFEKESLRLAIAALDILFPSLNARIGAEEVHKTIEKTLLDHRKTKEIVIRVPAGLKAEIESLIARIRAGEHEEVLWLVQEDPGLAAGDCALEWSDGGAVRDSLRCVADMRGALEALLGEKVEPAAYSGHNGDSEAGVSDVLSKENGESALTGRAAAEKEHE